MDRLIPLVNKLQDVFSKLSLPLDLDLPQIAVIGSQSAGKSSVLENFVGRDFLPRGCGIVTRRPLVLQLYNDHTEYGEFLHCRGKKFTNFADIRKEIEAETDRVTGSNKGISNIPINLQIHSPRVLNLTLIDLPGTTKVAVGDQPQDIEVQIRNMLVEFIEKENCLILAVTPANSDLANSDALKLAKEYDPRGLRTIGVLTKLDLMDAGTDAKDILNNKVLPLRRGYVGVVNRSQRDIDGNKDIDSALRAEKAFFMGHPSYSQMLDRLGTPYLQQVLNEQLTNHIRETLPTLKEKLQQRLTVMKKQLTELDLTNIAATPGAHRAHAIRLNRLLESDFLQRIEGYTGNEVESSGLSTGALIGRYFHITFPMEIHEALRYDKEAITAEIALTIQNVNGIRFPFLDRSGLFTPDQAFNITVAKLINLLSAPSQRCVQQVVNHLVDVLHDCLVPLKSYPKFQNAVSQIIQEKLKQLETETLRKVEELLDYQRAYNNTNHEDFVAFHGDTTSKKSHGVTEEERILCKGWLSLIGQNVLRGGSRYFFFVLTTHCLKWYKDQQERDLKHKLTLDGVKLRTHDTGMFKSKPIFSLCFADTEANIYKDQKVLELSADTEKALTDWKACLLKAGVEPLEDSIERDDPVADGENIVEDGLRKQVGIILTFVDSYIQIVGKTHRDMVPKIIMHALVNQLKEFLREGLVAVIYGLDLDSLMEESPEQVQKRQEAEQLHSCLNEALVIITDVMSRTPVPSVPPPVKDDWLKPVETPTPVDTGRQHQLPTPVVTQRRPVSPSPANRPAPNRPAPNLPPVRMLNTPQPGQMQTPLIPTRMNLNPSYSSSTGNLPGSVSTGLAPPPSTTGPVKNGSVASIASAFAPVQPSPSVPERPVNLGQPRIPPRPTS